MIVRSMYGDSISTLNVSQRALGWSSHVVQGGLFTNVATGLICVYYLACVLFWLLDGLGMISYIIKDRCMNVFMDKCVNKMSLL